MQLVVVEQGLAVELPAEVAVLVVPLLVEVLVVLVVQILQVLG